MLTKLNIYIIFLPFNSVLLSSILFLFFQIFFNKKYLLNLLVSLLLAFIFILTIIYLLFSYLTDQQIVYLKMVSCLSH